MRSPVQALRSWLATLGFLPAFGLVLVVFDVAQRIARIFGQRPQEYVAGALQVALVGTFRLFAGTRLVVERAPDVERGRSYIFVSNHQSMFDIPILGTLLFSNFPKYISKRSLGRWIPSVSYNLRRGGHVLIDRSDAPSAIAAIAELGRRVRRGAVSASIFPEGTRARQGDLGQFRRAGLMALLENAPETPVVPITIDHSWRLLTHNFLPVPWGVHIRVRIDSPIVRRPDEDRALLVDRVRATMQDALSRWREEAPAARASAMHG
jgi:1-acyl-sn-glycerol-3-phosphate acyltransferase